MKESNKITNITFLMLYKGDTENRLVIIPAIRNSVNAMVDLYLNISFRSEICKIAKVMKTAITVV